MKPALFTFIFLLAFSTLTFSQKQVRENLRKGNSAYKKEKYTDAEIGYRKALEVNTHSTDAAYNLGNSLFKQGKFPEATEQYLLAAADEKNKEKAAVAWHNTGNVFLTAATAKEAESNPQQMQESLKKSIEAYKQSLRRNPNDDETRYNLALAQKLLADQQGDGGGDDDKQDKQDKEEKQDKQDQQKQDQQQQQDQQKQDQQQQQQQQNEMKKENAEQILDAMMQNERDTQEKVKEEKARQVKQRKTDKNW